MPLSAHVMTEGTAEVYIQLNYITMPLNKALRGSDVTCQMICKVADSYMKKIHFESIFPLNIYKSIFGSKSQSHLPSETSDAYFS